MALEVANPSSRAIQEFKSPYPLSEAALPAKQRNADSLWSDLQGSTQPQRLQVSDEVRAYYDKKASGGLQSFTERVVTVTLEGSHERLSLIASTSTTVAEVKEMISDFAKVDSSALQIFRSTGRRPMLQKDCDEVASSVLVSGIRSFKQVSRRSYRHPIAIIGAGLGAIQTALVLKGRGREDFLMIDRCSDFGGASWIVVANKFTKLQTERGTYHVDYVVPGTSPPKEIEGVEYKTWPSRDLLLKMFRAQADHYGLREKTRFNTSVEKVQVQRSKETSKGLAEDLDRSYLLRTVPVKVSGEKTEVTGDGELLIGSACISWPGNLSKLNLLEFPGEDAFNGYIEYASFDRMDFSRVASKICILYGHGAFVIENVRTLLEHRAKKVVIMCRRRNICGMRAVSWMVGYAELPLPGNIMLDAMQRMYSLVGFDVWSAYSVRTNEKRTFAMIDQKTVFGVTDVYFLAGYYGLMEVVVDEIERLSHHCAHCLHSGRQINDVEVIMKAVGTLPDSKTDKVLNIKEMVGFWVNGDPLMPAATNGMNVRAQNFGSFSSGPGFAMVLPTIAWFIDFPEDFQLVAKSLPVTKKMENGGTIARAQFLFGDILAVLEGIPGLAAETAIFGALKARKMKQTHPPKEFVAECKKEWEMYIKNFKAAEMVDDRPEPAYPYTEEVLQDYLKQTEDFYTKRAAAGQKS